MAEKQVLVNLDFKQNEIQNAVIQVLASNPALANLKNGQIWYNSTEGYIYFCQELNGTKKLLPVGYLPVATAEILGGVKIGSNINVTNDGVISVHDGGYTQKGVVEMATEAEVDAGTSEVLVVNVKQLKTAIDKALTSALNYKGMCKESQLPQSGDKVGDFWSISDFDVTHPSSQTGHVSNGRAIWNGTSWDKEVDEFFSPDDTTISLNGSGELQIKPFSQVDSTSTQTATFGGTVTVIDSVTRNGYGQVTGLNVKTVTLPGLGKTSATAAQGDLAEYIANKTKTVRASGTSDTLYPTEKAVRDALDTLDNKKQDRPSSATQNNIAVFNSTKDTVDSGKAFTTTIAASGSAVDTKVPTEKAVRDLIEGDRFAVQNPLLTTANGICTWEIDNTIGKADVIASIRQVSDGNEVLCDVTYTASKVTVKINSAANIAKDTYRAVILG